MTWKAENAFDIIELLQACTRRKDLRKGLELHAYIQERKFLEKNAYIGSTLVNMYAKCDALPKAEWTFKELPFRNVAAWSALIAAYTQHGLGEDALKCFEDMLHEGHTPDAVTFICVLKACGSIGAAAKGAEIHERVVCFCLLENNIALGNSLVDMYAKCGAVAKAHQVLEELPIRNVVTWSALIGGYAQQGQGEEALKCFDDMLRDGHSPNAVTFVCALKACASIGAIAEGEEIHEKIVNLGMLEKSFVLASTLVGMYMKCGAISKAQQVLKDLPVRDVVTWIILIAGFVHQGKGEEALKCFDDMLHEGHSPSPVTFISVLKACGSIRAAAKGAEIHERIFQMAILENDIVLGNSLVDMYARCGALDKAQRVLEELPNHNVVTWNALITGCVSQMQYEQALKCFNEMLHEGFFPNTITFICVLKVCGGIQAAAKGEEIHEKIVEFGMLEKDVVLGNSLVDMYVKCGALVKAQQVLKELPNRDVVTWTAIIAGYAQQGLGEESLKCFDDMLHEGHSPNAVTFTCVLKACGSIGSAVKGEEIHEKIVSLHMLEKDTVLGSTLVDMYVKCGAFSKAQQALEEFCGRNAVTWSALIGGHMQQRQGEEALKCFDDMLHEGHSPDVVTFTFALKACVSIGASAKGAEIHSEIVNLGLLEKDIALGSTVINMYAKCGALSKAHRVLEELPVTDVVTWSALIAGYAHQGQSLEAINCLEKMQSKGVKPNSITFTSVLNACSHSGLMSRAKTYFSVMSTKHGTPADLELYCCIIDVFGRAGKFNNALSVIANMPFDKCVSNWVALLGACRKLGEVKIGRLAFEHALHLDKTNAAVYVLMADVCTQGMQYDVEKTMEDARYCCTDASTKMNFSY